MTTWCCWNHGHHLESEKLLEPSGVPKRHIQKKINGKLCCQSLTPSSLLVVVPALFHHFIPPQLSQFTHLLLEFHSSLGNKVMDSSLGTSVGMVEALVNGYRLFSTSISAVESHLSDLGGKPRRWKNVLKFSVATKHRVSFCGLHVHLMWIA